MICLTPNLRRRVQNGGIRSLIFLSFTVTALIVITGIWVIVSARFSKRIEDSVKSADFQTLHHQATQLTKHIRDLTYLSQSVTYNIVESKSQITSIKEAQMQMLQENYITRIRNILIFDNAGNLLFSTEPIDIDYQQDPAQRSWFRSALHAEGSHLLLSDETDVFPSEQSEYGRQVLIATAVNLSVEDAGQQERGVLVILLRHSAIIDKLSEARFLGNDGYLYMMGNGNTLLYHPRYSEILTDAFTEDTMEAYHLEDGSHLWDRDGPARIVTVYSLDYAGWKLISVSRYRFLERETVYELLLLLAVLFVSLASLIGLNIYISALLAKPIQELDISVQRMQHGGEERIYIGGSAEIRHLGQSIQEMTDEIQRLAKDAIQDQELIRKKELEALQGQINPHFLYNTLDVIVWMIERNRPSQAVEIVVALANLFRISLSKGSNIISVKDELEHVRNYLEIQQIRFRNKFAYQITAEPAVLELATVKLVLQPIVENAIYHSMEYMDVDGAITIKAWLNGDLYMAVTDNGVGIAPEILSILFTDEHPSSKGSGVGLKNVNDRLRLYGGEGYGLTVQSELDKGTCIILRIPARPYGDADRDLPQSD